MYEKRLILIAFFALGTVSVRAQERVTAEVHFRPGRSVIERGYRNNAQSLSILEQELHKLQAASLTDCRIDISASNSPEGSYLSIKQMSDKRLQVMRQFVLSHFAVPDSLLILNNKGIGWEKLAVLVRHHSGVPYRERTLAVLEDVPEFIRDAKGRHIDGKKKQLMEVGYGQTWWWMTEYLFADLRSCSVSVSFREKETPKVMPSDTVKVDMTVKVDTVVVNLSLPPVEKESVEKESVEREPVIEPNPEPIFKSVFSVQTPEPIRKGVFAFKTNLLFDAASLANVELEVPLGDRWSVAGEWIFPWWLWKKEQICVQSLSGNLEGRYWLGDRVKLPRLTGWFAGVYAGAGLYDLEWKTKGYQGEFFIAAGLSAGYAHTINKSGSLRMEYALGVGYMSTKYREYKPVNDGEILAWQKDGRYSWVGPTRAKVSLVWMFHAKNKKGGIR